MKYRLCWKRQSTRRKANLNAHLNHYKDKIKSGVGTDQDIEEYNAIIDQLVLYGSEKCIPDEFWTDLSNTLDDAIRCKYPNLLNGTTYIKYKVDSTGVETKEVVHQRRDGRPPTSYQLVADGEQIRRRDFLLQYCGETDNRISWSRVRQYAKDLVANGVFVGITLLHFDDDGTESVKWSEGI